VSILSTSNAQLQVDVTPQGGHTASVTNLTYVPQPGGARQIQVFLTVDSNITVTITMTVRDDAFEESDIFGKPKGQAGGAGVPSSGT